MRPTSVSQEIQDAELKWWKKYSNVEYKYAWVQLPWIQAILRGHYIREIISLCPKDGRIVELGCGMGWLSCVLAESGAHEVWGTDFSEAQIELANVEAKARNVSDRVKFVTANSAEQLESLGQFDVVIVHAFLHHLTVNEIAECLASIPKYLKKEGKFLVFEPVIEWHPNHETFNIYEWFQRKLAGVAHRGKRIGLRHFSEEEILAKSLLDSRNEGKLPHGPSPKEMPFNEGELEEFLGRDFLILRKEKCIARSYLTVQEWLLRGLSHPVSTKILLPIVVRAAAWLDRRVIRSGKISSGTWVFSMFVCKSKPLT